MTRLSGDILHVLVPGTTHLIERNGAEAAVYLATDGSGHMRLEDGEVRKGRWRLLDDGYATEWDGGQTGDWVLERSGNGLHYVSRDGKVRLKMLGILFGDARGLA